MGTLSTVAKCKSAFFRLLGTESDDPSLVLEGESADDVLYLYLTRGTWTAQRWMLKMGYQGWRQRSAALTWTGTDATTGGTYSALPSDFLRAYGSARLSALVKADGTRWGDEISAEEEDQKGDGYYFRGDNLWLTRGATPPATLYLEYHYQHPAWSSSVTIDFPVEARPLLIAEAASAAKEENWLPGGAELEQKIERALFRAREEARDVVRPTKQQRRLRKAPRYGNHW